MPDKIWKDATSIKSLEAGWHLTRVELRAGFFHDYIHQQAVAQSLDEQIIEIKRLLDTKTYRFRPLRKVLIPKGPLSTRPGSHLPLRDRIIFWAIIRKIAPLFDSALSDNVYSYRLKENPKAGELFKEGDVLSLPFLKRAQIAQELDPFEPWYGAWPDFEERTKEEIGRGYDHLVVSDIAGYFENINIDILKDQIISFLEGEPILSNFISYGLSEWVSETQFGSRPKRSIPQGSGISSFFGNIYLAPVDDRFIELSKKRDFRYIRYMDDIRIFAKDMATARFLLFEMESAVRELHLNLQSSKTKILVETQKNKEITNFLFDDRVELIAGLRESVEQSKITEDAAKRALKSIARKEPRNPTSQKLLNVGSDRSNLTDRAMRAWMNFCMRLGSRDYISTLLKQIHINPDQKLSKIYVNTCRTFPRSKTLGDTACEFIRSNNNIHQFQEAEIIKGCRYLSEIPDFIWKRALQNIWNPTASFQLRIQSLTLLGMRSHNEHIYNKIFDSMKKDVDIVTHPYYFCVLGQLQNGDRAAILKYYTYHANQHNQEFGLLLDRFNTKYLSAKKFIDFVFGSDVQLSDWQGMLFFMAESENVNTKKYLLKSIRERLKLGGRGMLKKRLAAIRNRTIANLEE